MRKKHRRKLLILTVAYLFLWINVQMPQAFGAASGNYTDLLPIGAAANTTVISNGTGWSLTTLPPTNTFGDGLSRVVTTVFQSTSPFTVSNSTALTNIATASGIGKVGSTTFPAAWVATGRSIRITADGVYKSSGSAVGPVLNNTWAWEILIGTMSVMISSQVVPGLQLSNKFFKTQALITIGATGATGNVNGYYDIMFTSGTPGATGQVFFSTATASAVTIDLATQLSVVPRFSWGVADALNSITFNNIIIEFLN